MNVSLSIQFLRGVQKYWRGGQGQGNFDKGSTELFSSSLADYFSFFTRFLKSELLKVTVTQLCGGATFFWLCPKYWDFHAQTKKLCILTYFTVFFSSYFTDITWFFVIFLHFFWLKISKLKFWTRKKSIFRMSVWNITLGQYCWLAESVNCWLKVSIYCWLAGRRYQLLATLGSFS